MNRRELLKAGAALAAAGWPAWPLLAAASQGGELKHLAHPEKFDYAWLKGHARHLAAHAYAAPAQKLPAAVEALDWDQYQAIRYRDEHALWAPAAGAKSSAHGTSKFRAKFFHLGLYFHEPVKIYEVEHGLAQEIAYDPGMFDYGKSGLNGKSLPEDLGFAGFRVNVAPDWQRDVFAFLGASYFRAVGGEHQYGLSARGLAIDCGLPRPEEFPVFRKFWLEKPTQKTDTLTIYALLDSPSIAGAYRFLVKPGQTLTMDVDAALYPRKTIERLGIAPLTSMFWYGENDKRALAANKGDWRPEIHDSDGLSMWLGNGEWVWRPLTNPLALRFNAYQDDNPRGFGLLQRDRNFDHYQDDGVFYDRRPSLWIEPMGGQTKGGWGKGSVQLVEIPTEDETFDNIVAFWNPEEKTRPGEELLFAYRLHWGARMPFASPLAHVAATWTGPGGVVGKQRTHFSWRFVVDFAGDNLKRLGRNAKLKTVITASRGEIELPSVRPLDSLKGYRAIFDIQPDKDSAPIDLRLYIADEKGNALSETWLYQWTPPPAASKA
jgi:glucans biosynthesis protein